MLTLCVILFSTCLKLDTAVVLWQPAGTALRPPSQPLPDDATAVAKSLPSAITLQAFG
jgi:hypothetical protein